MVVNRITQYDNPNGDVKVRMGGKAYAKLKVIGEDYVGLTAEVTGPLSRRDVNFERWNGSTHGDEYHMRALISAPQHRMVELRSLLRSILPGLKPQLKVFRDQQTWTLDVAAPDQPGIAAETAEILAHHKLNIEWDDRFVRPAPFAGDPIFHQSIVVTCSKLNEIRMVEVAAREIEEQIGGNVLVLRGAALAIVG